jgi:Ca-activated chloride channel homolog
MILRLLLIISFTGLTLALIAQNRATHEALRLGDRAIDRTQFEKAEKHYQQAQLLAPQNSTAGYNLGVSQYNQGKYEEAGITFSSMLDRAQTPQRRADAYHNLGNSMYQQKKYDAAVKAYEQSLRNRPGDAGTQQNLTMARKKQQEQQSQQQQSPPPTPPPNPERQPDDSDQQPLQPDSPRDESDEQMLQYIDEADKKNRRKYQDKSAQKADSRNKKDW